jgi:AraC-like DNA-binding protein
VRGYAVTHPPGRVELPTESGWDQLLYTASGTMTVSAVSARWTVPPHRALSIPDGAPATIGNRFPVAVRTLYVDAALHAFPPGVRALEISGFPRELLLHIVRRCPLDVADGHAAALLAVLVEQLRALPEAPLRLPWPADARAVAAASRLTEGGAADLDEVARVVGASRRTLERAFRRETGLTLGAWRRRARILGSLHQLAAGTSVTATGLEAGYTTPSAYVAAFHRELGRTPRQFLHP